MASSANQPLLDTHKKTSVCYKTLLYSLTTATITIVVVFSAVFLVPNLIQTSQNQNDLSTPYSHLCKTAYDPQRCHSLISQAVQKVCHGERGTISILRQFLINYAHQMDIAVAVSRKLRNQINDENEVAALSDCLELIDLSIDQVKDSVKSLENPTKESHLSAQTLLSGVLTNHVTCLDGLKASRKTSLQAILKDLISRARAALAMAVAVAVGPDTEMTLQRLVPSWITPGDRKLLQSVAKDIKADLIVAKDGTGNYTKVADALAEVPDKGKRRFVIYVKKGTYEENVEVGKKKQKVMIVGDGMDSTTITGSLNVVDGSTTFRSATLAAVGEGFMLQDICIQNTAGPEKHQAVALRVGADQSVINRCKIDAYQDTLYAHSLRQFYRDSYITGTVDFIFGNAAVVLQKCKLVVRKPMKSQKNMVTAQGRVDPNQNTGTSIQDCDIIPSADLELEKSSFPTYLGRPWKEYSRTVVMESNISDHIDPAGWAEWSGDFALNTLYYGEYMNRGAGAGTSKRVNWPGYHVITDPDEAMKFTVKELIQGGEWLSSTGVAFTEGL